MQVLEDLKRINFERLDIDDAVGLLAFGRMVEQTYVGNDLSTPEWLKETTARLASEVKTRRREQLEMALKEARMRKAALASREERRAALDQDIASIEQKLAGG